MLQVRILNQFLLLKVPDNAGVSSNPFPPSPVQKASAAAKGAKCSRCDSLQEQIDKLKQKNQESMAEIDKLGKEIERLNKVVLDLENKLRAGNPAKIPHQVIIMEVKLGW